MTEFRLDRAPIDALVAGTLDRVGEAALADQVARVLPFHWMLPNSTAQALSRIRHHFGGEPGLLDWLDRHPGRPRLVARVSALIGLLDEVSGQPAVLDALRALRAQAGDPPELTGYLVADTDSKTLPSLGTRVESLLGEDLDEAARVAIATVTMLLQATSAADDSAARDLRDRLGRLRQRIIDADQQLDQPQPG